jgi:hypothetical protein
MLLIRLLLLLHGQDGLVLPVLVLHLERQVRRRQQRFAFADVVRQCL